MADETTSQATPTAQAEQAADPGPASADQKISFEAPSEAQATTTFEPLFDTESVSEAELRGDEPPTEEQDKPTKPDTKPPETKDAGSSPPKGEEKPAEDASGEAGETDKPPKGFVSIKALHQERGQRQALSQELSRVRAELEQIKANQKPLETTAPAAEEDAGFKVLSDAEFESLLEEDPVEAIKYDRKLRAYEAKQAEKAKAEQLEQDVINQSIGMMAEAIPGLYDETSDINQRLSDFAVSNGFTDVDGLALVTDPRTKVIPANGGKPQPLGQVAAHLVLMLNNLFQEASKATDKNDTTDDAKKKLEQSVREQVTKELLSKIKQPAGAEHKSIGDIPGDAGDTAPPSILTEADFAKLSDADQRRLLGG